MLSADDEEDFSSASSSKLASLFGLNRTTELGNTTLTYTAPKQPRKDEKIVQQDQQANQNAGKTSKPTKLNIIVVKPVHTYKLEAINYSPQGKLGAAILGNVESRIFQLLLYKGQQQHVTSARISSKFQFTVQANNYGTFYDDQSQNWSIMFEGAEHAVEFAREIALARAISQNAEEQQSPCVQELLTGTGVKVKLGDALELQYSAKQLSGHQLGKEIDSNMVNGKGLRVKVKKDVWEECLLGLCKGAKRIIVLPPHLMGMWKEQVDVGCRLVLEVEVSRVKISSGSKESVVSRVPSSHDSGESAFDSSADDGSIKARGASISEALSNSPKTNKASIISRMAKMGQATLPLKGAISCNPSDSEETEEEGGSIPKVLPVSVKPAAKPRSMKSRSSLPTPVASDAPSVAASSVPQSVALYHGVGVPWQQVQHPPHAQQFMRNGSVQQFTVASPYTVEGQLFPVVPHVVSAAPQVFQAPATTPPALTSPDTHIAVFLSETRTHNSEVRMGVAKVADKVDQLICKVDGLQHQHQQQRPIASGGLDPETLLASIQKIVVENEQLRGEIVEKRNKLDELNDKMYKLLQANQKFMEQDSDKVSRGESAQALIATLQQEKSKQSSDLQSAECAISSLQAQVTGLQERESILSSELASLSSQLQAAREETEKKTTLMLGLEKQIRQSESWRQSLEESLQSSQNELSRMTQENEELAKELDSATHRLKSEREQVESVAVSKYKEQIQEMESKLAALANPTQPPYEKELKVEFQQKLSLQKDELEKKYTSIIQKLEKEISILKMNRVEATEQVTSSGGDRNSSMVADEVKKVMNMVYKQLHVHFQPKSSFQGSEVRDFLLSTIRNVTLHLLADKDGEAVSETNKSTEKFAVPNTSGNHATEIESTSAVQDDHTESHSEPSVTVETSCSSSDRLRSRTDIPNDLESKTEKNIVLDHTVDPSTTTPKEEKAPQKSSEEFFSDKDWLPQRPVPPPLFDDNEDDDDDWLS